MKCIEWNVTFNTSKRSKVPRIHDTSTPESQISHLWVTDHFIQEHWMTLKGQSYPIYILLPPPSPMPCLSVTGHFETSAPNDPKMNLNTKRSKVPHIHGTNYPWVPDFTPFRCTASCFQVTGHFETSAAIDPKMTFNTKRLKVPHSSLKFHSFSLHG